MVHGRLQLLLRRLLDTTLRYSAKHAAMLKGTRHLHFLPLNECTVNALPMIKYLINSKNDSGKCNRYSVK